MQQVKRVVLALVLILAVSLTGALPVAGASASASSGATYSAVASFQADDKGPGKGNDKKDKGNDDKGNNGKKNDDKNKDNNGNAGKGNNDKKDDNGNGRGNSANAGGATINANPPGRGLGVWWREFRSRFPGGPAADDFGGWQLGRFKDAFPFAHPQGWQARERGDAMVVTGPWQGGDFVFQLTRTVQVGYESLRHWVESDLNRFGVSRDNARFVDAGRTQVAVITAVNDPGYDCPVAYVYLWTQNPAGRNQRQAMGVISQAQGSACNTAALNAFIDQYLAQIGQGQRPLPLVTPTAPAPSGTPAPTVTPFPTATPGQTGWQQTRLFNAFSFAYPPGWSMDRLGDTTHLQGNYQGRAYVMDVVWVRSAPQSGLEQWVRADLADLGLLQTARIDYARQGDAQIAVVPGLPMAGYACPVVRFYVMADNSAGDGTRAFSGILAQANGQACDPASLENLAYEMLRQA
jgi:hypothetical protein